MVTAKGLLQKQHQEIEFLKSKVVDLAARGMANNLVFMGIEKNKNENRAWLVLNFIQEEMGLEVDPSEILKVHCLGGYKKTLTDL